MHRKPYLDPYTDASGEHRGRTRAGNHEILMVISEGIKDEDDVLVGFELLNDAYANDTDHRRRTDAAMARRMARLLSGPVLNPAPFGSLSAGLGAPHNHLAEADTISGIGTPPLNRLLVGLGRRD